MTLSIWRYTHLALAVVASAFIFVATVTGMVLAFEPIVDRLKPMKSPQFDEVTLGQAVSILKKEYAEVISLEVDENHFVKVEVIDHKGINGRFFVNPKTAEKIGEIYQQNTLFNFSKTLHRSLFLGKVGRVVMAVTSFLLFLLAISGTLLVIRRQKSWKHFFDKIAKENFFSYYHTVLGRLSLLPLCIVTLTGVYLSLDGFSVFPKKNDEQSVDEHKLVDFPQKEIADFESLQIPLTKVKKVEFPLFEDVEEFYSVKLIDKELIVNQFTGEIVRETSSFWLDWLTYYSLQLHTGKGLWLWAVVLFFTCLGVLFFMYSGFSITLKRRKTKIKNPYKKETCSYFVLVGSENGSTLDFSVWFHNQLLKQGKRSFLTELNDFSACATMKHLVVMTATYGTGKEPSNATKFKKKWSESKINPPFTYSVVGFGSLAYPDFCKYAYQVDELLQKTHGAEKILELHTINNKSLDSFSQWVQCWAEKQQIALPTPKSIGNHIQYKQRDFKVVEKTYPNNDETFLVKLQPVDNVSFESGDLLRIMGKLDNRERLYSIAKVENSHIFLSVKRHINGEVSNFLNELKIGTILEASIQKNQKFHFPKKAKQVVCIANGTGIAPFIGMIEGNNKKIPLTLFWGCRTKESFQIYEKFIQKELKTSRLSEMHVAFSREENRCYVQGLVQQKAVFFADLLEKGGVIMICGSVAMQQEVTQVLDEICSDRLKRNLRFFQDKGQLKMDCY